MHEDFETKRNEIIEKRKEFTEALISAADEAIDAEIRIAKPADYTSEETLYRNLIAEIKKYHPSDDLSMIEKAYKLAKEAHKDQTRKSGEPYIIHPVNVALILAELQLDKETIVAGILHDVLEDTVMTYDALKEQFGEEVANLVEGVTKVTAIEWGMDKEDVQAESLRKMFMAMAKDIRVILVKLADRLHNMRTYKYWSPETQKRKAKETMEIFSPIADRLGISTIKIELDDRSLAILHPEEFEDLTRRLQYTKTERETFIDDKKKELLEHLTKENIKAEIFGRIKHVFSIYKKMKLQHKSLDQIYDIFAIRILVDNVIDCYAALGVVHEMYTPIPGRFKDYIAMPKENMYQSLHTTVIGPLGVPFEIQIRTFEMHRAAEYGIAAHWKYKEKGSVEAGVTAEEQKLNWLRSIMDWQTTNSKEFVSLVRDDLDMFSDTVYCFTPNGEVKTLPAGSCTVDFAYSIHSAVGNRMVGAKVNGQLVPIETKLQNGDRVEIMTSQNSNGPSLDWLKIIKSSQARNKINQWFKTRNKEEDIQRGREAFQKYCKEKGHMLSELTKQKYIDACLQKYRYPDWDSVMASIGRGGLKEGQVVGRLLEEVHKEQQANITDEDILRSIEENSKVSVRPQKTGGIMVKGLRDLSVRFSHCCNPVPGDEIIGYVTRGRGVSIHRTDCKNIMGLPDSEKERLMVADWSPEAEKAKGMKYATEISIFSTNRIGLFTEISKVMTENEIDILAVSSRVSKQGNATMELSFEISSIEELEHLISKLRMVNGVIDIERGKG